MLNMKRKPKYSIMIEPSIGRGKFLRSGQPAASARWTKLQKKVQERKSSFSRLPIPIPGSVVGLISRYEWVPRWHGEFAGKIRRERVNSPDRQRLRQRGFATYEQERVRNDISASGRPSSSRALALFKALPKVWECYRKGYFKIT